MEPKKILIVEDDINIIDIYKIKFEKEWFDVKIAENWLIALWLIADYTPDLILLDVMMPSMNWYDSLTTLKHLAPSMKNSKIIMFSNLWSKEDVEKAMEMWADWYIVKANFEPKEVVLKVKEYLWMIEETKILLCPHCHKNIYEK